MNVPAQLDDSISGLWKWIAGGMASLVFFLLGGALGSAWGTARLTKHERLDGHPVTVTRLQSLETQIKGRLDRLETKVDRLLERHD